MSQNNRPVRSCSHLAALIAAAFVGGCAVLPVPLTSNEVRERVNSDQVMIYVEQEQVDKPITFEEAVARALKYNLDYRLKMMESALASGMAELSRYDMLPNLLATAGYAHRSNDSGGNSVNIDSGLISLNNSTSQERTRRMAGAEFSWNALDFGVSYYRAKQQADQFLIAEERRRRVIQNILQDTRSAYWRAVGAQRLVREAEGLGERARGALERSREAEAQGLLPPKDALNYQRLLLDALQLLASRRQELEFAKRELSALMNVTPGTQFTVVEADEPALLPVPTNLAELEDLALTNRPELREEDLRVRITADDARRQLLSLLPGISFNAGPQYDSNKYLYNNSWVDSGVRVSFNLFKALSLPAMQGVHDAQKRNDEARRLALSMAVLTQVRVSIERYRLALHDLDIARESSNVDQRLAAYARAAASTRSDNELELIRAETRALNSEYQRYAAYAAAQTAFGRIYNSIGLEVVPEKLESDSVADVAKVVAAHIRTIETETFPRLAVVERSVPPLRLEIEMPNGGRDKLDATPLRAAAGKALSRNRVGLAAREDQHAPTLVMRLTQEAPRDGVRRAHWDIVLKRADGVPAGSTRYSSTLAEANNSGGLAAFTEAAVVANLRQFAHWLATPENK